MSRLCFITLLTLALSGFTSALPSATQEQLGEVHTLAGWDWTDCGLSSDLVQLKSLEVSPDPPKPGENLTITVKGYTQGDIKEGAYADVVVKLGLIKLLTQRFDVCEEARNANASVQCPVKEGEYEVVQTVALPKEIPPAKFTINVRGYTEEEDDMLCLNLKADFTKGFPRVLGF